MVSLFEIHPAAYSKLQTSVMEFSEFMSGLGYAPHSLNLARTIQLDKLDKPEDVVFIPKVSESSMSIRIKL